MNDVAQKQFDDTVAQVIELTASGKLGEVIDVAQRAEQAYPHVAVFPSSLSYAYQQRGDLKRAVEAARRALVLEPADWTALICGGLALEALSQDLEQALDWLLRANEERALDDSVRKRVVSIALRLGYVAEGDATAVEPDKAEKRRSVLGKLVDPATIVITRAIRSVGDWAGEIGASVLEAGTVEGLPFVHPRVWGQSATAETILIESNTPYVATLENVQIRSRSSLIVTPDGQILNDVGADPRFGQFADWRYDAAVLGQDGRRIVLDWSGERAGLERGIMLSGLASDAYGHWIPEYLARLPALMHHPEFANLPVIVDEGMPPTHYEFLSILIDNPQFLLKPNTVLAVGQLIVAPPPSFHPVELIPNEIPPEEIGGVSTRALRFYRSRIEERVAHTGARRDRRLFLPRRGLRWRRLVNEEALFERLQHLGFEEAHPETLTLRQQIELFRSAEAIVGPNGSALHNVIFASSQVSLVVLSQGALHNWGHYQGFMEALGYRPLFVCGAPMGEKHADYQVEIDDVVAALAAQGIA